MATLWKAADIATKIASNTMHQYRSVAVALSGVDDTASLRVSAARQPIAMTRDADR